jgi:uncharacterized protein YlzI (FlbEa/FlbD family)
MDISPNLPNIKKNSTKDSIIRILSYNWPLSIKKLKSILKKEYSVNVSYQSIYQNLNELLEKEIVIKRNNEYLLNLDWIEQIQEFGRAVKQTYNGHKKIIGSDIDSTQLTFDTGYEFFKFIIELISNHIDTFTEEEKKKGDIQIAHVQQGHLMSPFVTTKGDFKLIKKLGRYGSVYYACRGNTLVDKMLSRFYTSFNAKVKLGADVASDSDIYIVGDWVVQVFIPVELKNEIKKIFSSTKDILSFDIVKFFWNLGHQKHEFEVLINKNPLLAKRIKGQVMSYFKE